MGILHFLDVGHGDCSIIQHASGRNTVIDVCKARREMSNALAGLFANSGAVNALFGKPTPPPASIFSGSAAADLLLGTNALAPAPARPMGLLGLLAEPSGENPIRYMRDRGISDVFRFILTHPDMDHMDGIKDFFEEFPPTNFWDTGNTRKMTFAGNRFREEDWDFYKSLRDGKRSTGPKRLTLHSNASGPYYNKGAEDDESHDGLYVLAPTPALVAGANQCEDFNDCSYVILYRSKAGRILLCGDSHDNTWEHILAHHLHEIENIELMIAPHHGRDSDRDREFLTKVKPRLTLFGCAPSEHLAYDAWRNRGLAYLTGNQSGTVVVDTNGTNMQVYVANEAYARKRYSATFYSPQFRAWYIGYIA